MSLLSITKNIRLRDSHKEKNLSRGIKEGSKEAIEYMYEHHYTDLKKYVLQNQGYSEDAKDVFQESMFHLYKTLIREDIDPIQNVSGYFVRLYQNRWKMRLNSMKREREVKVNYKPESSEENDNYYYYLKALEKLGDDCKNVLQYYVDGFTTGQIARELKTSIDYAKRKKYLCKEKLKELAKIEMLKKIKE